MTNPLRYLKEKIIGKLTLEEPGDVKRLTVLAHDREALIIALGYRIAADNDPLELKALLDEWLTLRIAINGRARKDVKEVYTMRPFWERYSTYPIQQTSPVPAPELNRPEERTRRRRWL